MVTHLKLLRIAGQAEVLDLGLDLLVPALEFSHVPVCHSLSPSAVPHSAGCSAADLALACVRSPCSFDMKDRKLGQMSSLRSMRTVW